LLGRIPAGRCRQVVAVQRWPLAQVWLYTQIESGSLKRLSHTAYLGYHLFLWVYFETVTIWKISWPISAVGLLDMSSFAKFIIMGESRSVVSYLQSLCSNDVDIPVGGIIPTGMLNENGMKFHYFLSCKTFLFTTKK
jgi:hypothetical protein